MNKNSIYGLIAICLMGPFFLNGNELDLDEQILKEELEYYLKENQIPEEYLNNFNQIPKFSENVKTSVNSNLDESELKLRNEFDNIMDRNSKQFKNRYKGQMKDYFMVRNLYIKNHPSKIRPSKKPTIPKIIHQIWIGPKPVPPMMLRLQKTWQEKHPDWQYKLWRNENLKDFKLYNQDLFDRTPNIREKADLLRYEILYKIGGLYVDADFECLKSFDELHHLYDFYTGIAPNNHHRHILNNALIASRPGHPIMEKVFKSIVNNDKLRPFKRSGAAHFSRQVIKVIAQSPGKNMLFPFVYFYPIPLLMHEVSDYNEQKYIAPESMAVHYWANTSNNAWRKR